MHHGSGWAFHWAEQGSAPSLRGPQARPPTPQIVSAYVYLVPQYGARVLHLECTVDSRFPPPGPGRPGQSLCPVTPRKRMKTAIQPKIRAKTMISKAVSPK